MKENEFPVLKVSDIDWDIEHEEFDKLPKNFKLNWGSKNWDFDEVSNWVSQKFDWVFNSINISQVGVWQESSCCCAGGCNCC
ncbi:MAG: hypothetical protein CMG04_03830 [Candidatus Marinimicrobia bacterium]|nr:hypothetical protein [Candidatus Neomarinimicrobiota bacterium]